MNGRFASHLFSIIFIVSTLPLNLLGDDVTDSDNNVVELQETQLVEIKPENSALKFVELLEMQLVDIKKENSTLKDKLKDIQKENQSKSGYKKDIAELKQENDLLKSEITSLDKKNGDAAKVKAEFKKVSDAKSKDQVFLGYKR